MAPCFMRGSTCAKSLRFTSSVLDDGLDHEVGLRDAVAGHVGDEPVHRRLHEVRLAQAPAVELRGALDRRRDALGAQVLQRDDDSLGRRPGRDVAAHRAGADHVQLAHRLDRFLAEAPSGGPGA